jgi:hypothetical protein
MKKLRLRKTRVLVEVLETTLMLALPGGQSR